MQMQLTSNQTHWTGANLQRLADKYSSPSPDRIPTQINIFQSVISCQAFAYICSTLFIDAAVADVQFDKSLICLFN